MTKPGDHKLFDAHYETPDDADLFKKRPSSQWDADDIFTSPFEEAQSRLESRAATREDAPLEFPAAKSHGRFSMTQVMLMGAIVAVGGLLSFLMVGSPGPQESLAEETVMPNVPSVIPVQPVIPVPVVQDEPAPQQESVASTTRSVVLDGAVSLQLAEEAYQALDLERAYAVYERLLEDLPAGRDQESLAAFLQLRMGFCLRGLGRLEAADRWLDPIIEGHYPFLQAIVRYHQCMDRLHQQQYFPAAQRAYQALALIDCLEDLSDWHDQFKEHCTFLLGEALTLQTLSQYDIDEEFPVDLWELPVYQDPFIGHDEEEIARWVENGTEAFRLAQVGPRIERSPGDQLGRSWRVVCNGAPLDELLKRFASHTLMDLDWSFTLEGGVELVDEVVRQRPVRLFLRDVTPEEVAVQATGCALLFADMSQAGVIRIIDPKPQEYRSLARLLDNLQQESLAHWQRVTLDGDVHSFTPNAHFASALLLEYDHRSAEAITEYQLLANRFKRSSLAPYALMRSSRLRAELMDFDGARDDLRHLVEIYPSVDFKAQAYLQLAEATRQAGLLGEAVTYYRTVYFMDAPLTDTAKASLGAGQCHFERGEYQEAARWFIHYVDVAVRHPDLDAAEGYLMMGRTLMALERFEDASDALNRALGGDLDKTHYLEALHLLVTLDLKKGQLVEALNRLEADLPWDLTRYETNEHEALKAQVLLTMGLTNKALLVLEECLPYLSEARQRGRVYFQMAQTYETQGEWNKALTFYSDVIDTVDPGPIAQKARLGLARARMQSERYTQAIDLLEGVLDERPDEDITAEAYTLLIRAYQLNNQLDKAAQLLLQQRRPAPSDVTDANEVPVGPVTVSRQEVANVS